MINPVSFLISVSLFLLSVSIEASSNKPHIPCDYDQDNVIGYNRKLGMQSSNWNNLSKEYACKHKHWLFGDKTLAHEEVQKCDLNKDGKINHVFPHLLPLLKSKSYTSIRSAIKDVPLHIRENLSEEQNCIRKAKTAENNALADKNNALASKLDADTKERQERIKKLDKIIEMLGDKKEKP